MADEAVDTGATSSTPDTAPDPTQGVKDAALEQMSRREDISDYVKEREARNKDEAGEQTNGEGRDEDRAERIRRALNEAREATKQARSENGLDQPTPDLDAAYQDAEAQWNAAQAEETTFESERELARNEGRFQQVAENLKAANPQVWDQITDTMRTIDTVFTEEQIDAFKSALIAGNPQ